MKIISFLIVALLSALCSAEMIANEQFLVEEPEGDRDLGGCTTVTEYTTIKRAPSWSSRTAYKRLEAICDSSTGKNLATRFELSAEGDCKKDTNRCTFPTGNSAYCRIGAANVSKKCKKRFVPVKLELTCCTVPDPH